MSAYPQMDLFVEASAKTYEPRELSPRKFQRALRGCVLNGSAYFMPFEYQGQLWGITSVSYPGCPEADSCEAIRLIERPKVRGQWESLSQKWMALGQPSSWDVSYDGLCYQTLDKRNFMCVGAVRSLLLQAPRLRAVPEGACRMSAVIIGRPDFRDPSFGWTRAKHFPPYVHGTNGNARLMHRTAGVKLYWYRATGDSLIRLDSPDRIIAETVCGMSFFLDAKRGRTCTLPQQDTVLCGRCNGSTPTFSRRYPQSITPQDARQRLGCAMEGVSS